MWSEITFKAKPVYLFIICENWYLQMKYWTLKISVSLSLRETMILEYLIFVRVWSTVYSVWTVYDIPYIWTCFEPWSGLVLGEIRTDWSKCSKPCGRGEQRNSDGNIRSCNFEPCSIYEEGSNLLQGQDKRITQTQEFRSEKCLSLIDGFMLEDLSTSPWTTNGQAKAWFKIISSYMLD